MPSWCCAVLSGVDHTVSISRVQLCTHLLKTLHWYLLLIPLSVDALCGCGNHEARGDFLFSLPRMGILWREGRTLTLKGMARWSGFADTDEKLYLGLNTSCKNLSRGCPAWTMPHFLSLPNNRKYGIVVTAKSPSEFSKPCLLPFLSSSCVLVSANVPFLLLSSVLTSTPCK